jgi:hypothetical protein
MGSLAAATITTQVECDGVVYNASACSDSQTFASVTIGAAVRYVDSINLNIATDDAAFPTPPPAVTFSAAAAFQDDYFFTVTGGSGSGTINPCIAVNWDNDRGSGDAGIAFGSASLSTGDGGGTRVGNLGSCEGFSISSLPFTFGVPQRVTVSMSASAQIGLTPSQVDDSARLDGFQFFDDSGNQLSNVHFSLVSVSVPEPGMWFPLLGVFLLLSAWQLLRLLLSSAVANAAKDIRPKPM